MYTENYILMDLLPEVLSYDPDSGLFHWRNVNHLRCVKSGDIAGYTRRDGYTIIGLNNRNYYAHHLAWLWCYGSLNLDGYEIDHINGIANDNRIANLRLCTRMQNSQNRHKQSNNTSGYKGVSWESARKKWRAQIRLNKKTRYLGLFQTKEAAYKAYCDASRKYFDEFSRV